MPFSNNTKRQRWEKGQVVPEYKTIMGMNPSMKNSGEAVFTATPLSQGQGNTPTA
ncbi:MAG: hypothetical protein Q7U45_09840 [Burkholderiaceae bacterium]|nr:hypothetical protein [Burkholderiaceae bacterium]